MPNAPAAGALQHPPEHDDPHRRCGGGDEQAGDEQHDAGGIRPRRTVAVGQLAGGDERDEVGQRVGGQCHAVQRVATELVGDRRQRGDHAPSPRTPRA